MNNVLVKNRGECTLNNKDMFEAVHDTDCYCNGQLNNCLTMPLPMTDIKLKEIEKCVKELNNIADDLYKNGCKPEDFLVCRMRSYTHGIATLVGLNSNSQNEK